MNAGPSDDKGNCKTTDAETQTDGVLSPSAGPITPLSEEADCQWDWFDEMFGLPPPRQPGQRRFLGVYTARRLRREAQELGEAQERGEDVHIIYDE
jgi:hypothetical protein